MELEDLRRWGSQMKGLNYKKEVGKMKKRRGMELRNRATHTRGEEREFQE